MSRFEPHQPTSSPDGFQELATIPGDRPGESIQLRYCPAEDGCVRLEQLAFNRHVGWYRQKTMTLPRAALKQIADGLRLADCLMPEQHERSAESHPFRLVPAEPTDRSEAPMDESA